MKTIVCQEPGHLVMKEVSRPALKPGEALVRIRRVGMCGTDLHAFRGVQPYFTYPRILGHEISGELRGGRIEGSNPAIDLFGHDHVEGFKQCRAPLTHGHDLQAKTDFEDGHRGCPD